MNSGKKTGRGPVFFCYAAPAGFSGQKEATEMVLRGLTAREWDCRRLPQPVLERGRGGAAVRIKFGLQLLSAWLRSLRMLGAPGGSLCVNLGQTRFAFLRDAVPLFVGRWRFGRARVTVSLHGSLFMNWADESWDVRLFVGLLRQAGTITVLGKRQSDRLIGLGIEAKRIEIVVNSCALPPISEMQLREKQAARSRRDKPLRILHLSSLIATKGFPEFLEALETLAGDRAIPAIEAVLCGCVTASEFQERFRDDAAAEDWIEKRMAAINRSPRVRVRWVRGAVGAEKEQLFRAADIFVLPTRYAVEAQPLVLLEAMASGCAIVTTAVGEIPTILDGESALFLGAGSTAELAAALRRLAAAPGTIGRLAEAAHRRFLERYQITRHLDGWEARLEPGRATAVSAGLPALSES